MRKYVNVVYTSNLYYARCFTYEVPNRFVKDIESGFHNLVVVERKNELTLALVVNAFESDDLKDKDIKPILDVCKSVKINANVKDRVAKSVGVVTNAKLF